MNINYVNIKFSIQKINFTIFLAVLPKNTGSSQDNPQTHHLFHLRVHYHSLQKKHKNKNEEHCIIYLLFMYYKERNMTMCLIKQTSAYIMPIAKKKVEISLLQFIFSAQINIFSKHKHFMKIPIHNLYSMKLKMPIYIHNSIPKG